MYNKYLLVFLIYNICGVKAQEYGEPCVTEDRDLPGTCTYENECRYALELAKKQIHPTVCTWENDVEVVCCPQSHTGGPVGRFFEYNDGIVQSDYMQCHYDGKLPLVCCPIQRKYEQPQEPKECQPLPEIETPNFKNPAHTVAWEKCVENERFVHVCVEENGYYKRINTCAIPESFPKLSGGEPAAQREFPHMAVLGCINGDKNQDTDIAWVGGGSLISDLYILTAGHVLASSTHGELRYALLGTVDKLKLQSGELYHITKITPHKKYVSKFKNHDIALLKLNRRVKFSEYVRPICLPVPAIPPLNDIRLVAGWGQAGDKAKTTSLLNKAVIKEVDGSKCTSSLEWKQFVWDDATMICAKGDLNRRGVFRDTCKGDSGGPLMYWVTNQTFNCNYIVSGVVSWGNVCAEGQPSSYTNVSAYLDWIVATVWPEELKKVTEKNLNFSTSKYVDSRDNKPIW